MKSKEYRTRIQELLRSTRQWREERILIARQILSESNPMIRLGMNMNPLTERAVIDAIDALDKD